MIVAVGQTHPLPELLAWGKEPQCGAANPGRSRLSRRWGKHSSPAPGALPGPLDPEFAISPRLIPGLFVRFGKRVLDFFSLVAAPDLSALAFASSLVRGPRPCLAPVCSVLRTRKAMALCSR